MVFFLHLPEKKLLADAQCASLDRTVYWRVAALPYVGRQSGSKKSTASIQQSPASSSTKYNTCRYTTQYSESVTFGKDPDPRIRTPD